MGKAHKMPSYRFNGDGLPDAGSFGLNLAKVDERRGF
jgi:hypothetical protein